MSTGGSVSYTMSPKCLKNGPKVSWVEMSRLRNVLPPKAPEINVLVCFCVIHLTVLKKNIYFRNLWSFSSMHSLPFMISERVRIARFGQRIIIPFCTKAEKKSAVAYWTPNAASQPLFWFFEQGSACLQKYCRIFILFEFWALKSPEPKFIVWQIGRFVKRQIICWLTNHFSVHERTINYFTNNKLFVKRTTSP